MITNRLNEIELQEYLEEYHRKMGHHPPPGTENEADSGPESILQGKIERWCKEWARPCLSFRQSKAAKRLLLAGWPDVTLIMPGGQVLFLELKSASGRLSDEQKQLKLQFLALNHEIHEVKSYKRFLELVKRNHDNQR